MPDQKPVRAVLFDLDQTLTDRPASLTAAAYEICRRFGPRFGARKPDAVAEMMVHLDGGGYTPRERFCAGLAERLGWAGCEDLIKAFWREEYPECAVEAQGASTVLADLRRRGLRLGIVTNGETDPQNRKIDHLGLRVLVDSVIVSATVGVRKPDAAIFHLALAGVGADAGETVYVGDHPEIDIVAGMAVGMRTVWIDGYFPWPADAPQRPPTIRRLADLPEALSFLEERVG